MQHTVTEWTSPPLRTSAQQLHAAMFRSARILQRMRGTAGTHKATTTAIRHSKRVVTQVNAVGTGRSLVSVGAGEVDASKCVPLVSEHNSWPPFFCASYYCAPHRTLVLCLTAVTNHASRYASLVRCIGAMSVCGIEHSRGDPLRPATPPLVHGLACLACAVDTCWLVRVVERSEFQGCAAREVDTVTTCRDPPNVMLFVDHNDDVGVCCSSEVFTNTQHALLLSLPLG